MEAYEVLGPVDIPANHIGASVGILFYYGAVSHPVYGDSQLKGIIPCFEPFRDYEAEHEDDEEETTFGAKMAREFAMSVAQDLEDLGMESSFGDLEMQKFTKHASTETLERYAWVFPFANINDLKIVAGMLLVTHVMEETFVSAEVSAETADPRQVLDIFYAALNGDFTNLSQLPGLPKHLHLAVASIILLRRECLKTKVRQGWIYVYQECHRYMEAVYNEHTNPAKDLSNYLNERIYTNAIPFCVECIWLYLGFDIPEYVRFNPAYVEYLNNLSVFTALVNDVVGLSKEIEDGESQNVVLLMAKSTNLQLAIDNSLKLMDDFFFKTKEAGRKLWKAFPHFELLERMLFYTMRLADTEVRVHEAMKFRYKLGQPSTLVVLKFNNVYQEKEAELKEILKGNSPTQNPSLAKILEECEAMKGNAISDKKNPSLEQKLTCENGNLINARHNPAVEGKSRNKNGTKRVEDFVEPVNNQHHALPALIPKLSTSQEYNVNHLAIIPDGNRRWAKSKKVPVLKGHWAGADALHSIVMSALELGIHTVTIWMLSSSNFKRPKEELENICQILRIYNSELRKAADKFDARICQVGKRHRLPEDILQIIEKTEAETAGRTSHRINIAIDYDGREEIVHAFEALKITHSLNSRPISPDDILGHLWGNDQPFPEPDLIVRTGQKDAGTHRTSGFMIWQAADSEFYFENRYLPEIEIDDLKRWLTVYKTTEKRVGL